MNVLQFLKNGSSIHIKKKNRGKFTDYCGGKVTEECIRRGKNSSNPTTRKRANFAWVARHKFKHLFGGTMRAGDKAKSNLTRRKNPDWNNIDKAYNYFIKRGLDHNSAVALLGNIIEESRGYYNAAQKNGGGRGLILWDGQPAPKGLYPLLKSIVDSVLMPANVYDSKTGKVSNYWKSNNKMKGNEIRKSFLNKQISAKNKSKLYAQSYLRPGKPRYNDRELSTAQIDSIYNPKIKNIIVNKKGGKAFVEGVNILDSNPKAYKKVKKKYKMRSALEGTKMNWGQLALNAGSNILQGYLLNKQISKQAETLKAMNKLTNEDFFNIYNLKLKEAQLLEEQLAKAIEAMNGTISNPSDIVARFNANKIAFNEFNKLKNLLKLQNALIDALAQALKANIWGDTFNNLAQIGMGMLSNYIGNKTLLKNASTISSDTTSFASKN